MADAKRTCSFDPCDDPVLARSLCSAHYQQKYRLGKPLTPKRVVGSVDERIEARIIRTESCWEWAGAHADTGYAQIRFDGKLHYVHRVMYERHHGPIATGMEIDHMCHNRGCINPAHLQQVTHKQNGENRAGPSARNTSGYRGVTLNGKTGKWIAQAGEHGRCIRFGEFDTAEQAAHAASKGRARVFSNSRRDCDPYEPIDDLDDNPDIVLASD